MDICFHVIIWTCLSICFLSVSSPSFGSWLRSLSCFFSFPVAPSQALTLTLCCQDQSFSQDSLSSAPLHFVGLHYSISLITLTFIYSTHPLWRHREQLWAGTGFHWISQCQVPTWVSGLGWWVSLGCFSCFISHRGLLQLKLTHVSYK